MTTVALPPGPSVPRFVQGIYALTVAHRGIRRMHERYGDAFTVNVPLYGRAVVISDPAEVRELFLTGPADADKTDRNLGRVMGPGSLFALVGEEHRRQRRLLVPPFHGRRLAAYEKIVEEETARELASWPQHRPFPTLPSMTRITLNIILRTVFGSEGAEFAELRELLPRMIKLGSRLAMAPVPDVPGGRWSPWPRFRAMRRDYDAVVDRLIAKARRDGDRDDVLALLLHSSHDDGTPMSNGEIADELLTLLAAGHETTATTLAWAVERLRRHPDVLRALVDEADADGDALRQATVFEVQRTRPVIDLLARQVQADGLRIGRWTVPKGYAVLVSITLLHENEAVYPDARTFDPRRFLGARPDLYQWIPFGGGARRCLGAAFAHMEMNVVLGVMLRELTLLPTGDPGERWHLRGVANAPAGGGRAVVRRRAAVPSRRKESV